MPHGKIGIGYEGGDRRKSGSETTFAPSSSEELRAIKYKDKLSQADVSARVEKKSEKLRVNDDSEALKSDSARPCGRSCAKSGTDKQG